MVRGTMKLYQRILIIEKKQEVSMYNECSINFMEVYEESWNGDIVCNVFN